MRKPNILFIQVDQMSAGALSAYGNGFSITPHLDRLCDQALVFENAYCNYPLCAPSRFSMMAGQLPSRIDAFDNAAELPASVPTFAHYLRAQGYQTSLIGKMHFVGPDQLHGFEERLTAELYPTDFAWNKVGTDFTREQVSDGRGVIQSGQTRNSVQIEHDELVAFNARRKLYDLARGGDDRPFLMVTSFTHPHEPYLCRQDYWDLYEDVEIPPPAVPRIPAAQMDPLSRRVGEIWDLFHDFGSDTIARARRAYYGNVSYVDRLIGDLLETLSDVGLEQNTVIVFTSDHGDMLGERGLWYKKVFFDPAARVPLVIRAPDHCAPGRVRQPVSLVDLAPTLMSLGGHDGDQPLVEPLDGNDLLARADGEAHDVVSEIMSEGLAEPVIMIRRGRHKFIGGPRHPSQLYDLEADPLEVSDLAQDAAYHDTLADFQAEMARRWDFDALSARILLSQKRRALIQKAHGLGKPPVWDQVPTNDEQSRWLRGTGDYGDWAFNDLPPIAGRPA